MHVSKYKNACVCVCVHVRSEHECVRTTPLLLMHVMTSTTCTHAHVHVASTLFPTFCPMLAAWSPASSQINWCREWGRFGVTNLSLFYYVVTRCIVFCARCAHTHTHTPSLEYAFVLVSLSTTLNLSICCMGKIKQARAHCYTRAHVRWALIRNNPSNLHWIP